MGWELGRAVKAVGSLVGERDGCAVGCKVGRVVNGVGISVGCLLGLNVGAMDGDIVGLEVGTALISQTFALPGAGSNWKNAFPQVNELPAGII